jgi:hypothetical protein
VGSVLMSGCPIAFATGGLSGLAAGQALRSLGAPVTLLDSPAETAPASAPGQAAHEVRLAKLIRRTSSEIRRLRTSVWEAELGDFDVVIYDRLEPGNYDPPAVTEYEDQVTRRNQTVWVAITANGLTDPDRGSFASSLALAAVSGHFAHVRETRGRPPLSLPSQPVHVDIGAREAASAAEELLTERLNGLLEAADGEPAGTGPAGSSARAPNILVAAADGQFVEATFPDADALADLLRPESAGAHGSPPDRNATHPALASQPYWIRGETRTASEWLTVLRGHRAVAERVMDAADLVASPALVDDGFFAKVVHPQWSTRRIVGLPRRFAGQKRFHLTALALLGRRGGNNGTV